MVRTPEKIKKGLECCDKQACEECPYDECGDDYRLCVPVLIEDSFELLRQLEAKDAKQRQRIEELEAQFADAKLNHQHTIDIAEKQRAQIGKLKKAIVRINIEKKGLELIIRGFPEVCRYCKNNDGEFCKGNPDAWGTCFEWIGIPSRTEAQPDA